MAHTIDEVWALLQTTDSDSIGLKVSACEGALSSTIISSPAYLINQIFNMLSDSPDHIAIDTLLSRTDPQGFIQVMTGLTLVYTALLGTAIGDLAPGDVNPDSYIAKIYAAVYRTFNAPEV